MKSNRIAIFVVVSLIAVIASGCSETLAEQAPENSTPAANLEGRIPDLRWGDGNDVLTESFDPESASLIKPDQMFTYVKQSTEHRSGKFVVVKDAVTADGSWAADKSNPRGIDPDTLALTDHNEMGILTGNSFKPFSSTRKLVKGDKYRQTVSSVVSAEDFVWVETESTNLFGSNWRIFSATRESRKSTLVAQSEDVWDIKDLPLTGAEPDPVIRGEKVYWSTTTEGKDEKWGSAIVEKNLDGTGNLQVLSEQAATPVATDNGIAFLGLTPDKFEEDPDSPFPGVATVIRIIGDDGSDKVLIEKSDSAKNDATFSSLKGADSTLLTDYRSNTLVIDTDKQEAFSVSTPTNYSSAGQQVCGDYATWSYIAADGTSDGYQYFFNSESKEFSKIKVKDLYGQTTCNGDYIAWATLDSGDKDAMSQYHLYKFTDGNS